LYEKLALFLEYERKEMKRGNLANSEAEKLGK